jgi:hypothetical protein
MAREQQGSGGERREGPASSVEGAGALGASWAMLCGAIGPAATDSIAGGNR